MFQFGRIQLHSFVKAHPPQAGCVPAPRALCDSYEGRLPSALIQLWRRHGLGRYGPRSICLIDPDVWQTTLDRWIVSGPDAVRVPIALTPFGTLLFYRRLTASDEDIVALDPFARSSSVLSWGLKDFFNGMLNDEVTADEVIPASLLDEARRACGALAEGEVYEVDQTLFTMQMLKITKVDALSLHQRLRAQVDLEQAPPAPPPASVGADMPAPYRASFRDIEESDAHPCGLYLSTYIDWRRLLALAPDGTYRLLFWRTHHKTGAHSEIRHYSGSYQTGRSEEGDHWVRLDIVLGRDSLGSDANDELLYLMRTGADTLLLQAQSLDSMATAIGGRGTLGRSEAYFRAVRLADPLRIEDSDGMDAPPLESLPAALKALVHSEPLRANILEVGEDGGPESTTVMVRVSLGSADGLRMNMPLMSPRGGRGLRGWVWRMDPQHCGVGIAVERDAAGAIVGGPQVGDVLVTRAD